MRIANCELRIEAKKRPYLFTILNSLLVADRNF